jgi:Anti-sigma-K factor rskA/Putative zinc-finger
MTHDELKALLPLAALNRLDPDEMAALREHLAGCGECPAELREFENAAAMMALAVDAPTSIEDRITRKLEARLATPTMKAAIDRAPSRSVESSSRPGSRSIATRISIAAAVVLAVYGAVVTSRLSNLQSAYNARENQLAYLQNRFTTLEHDAQVAEQRIDALSKVLSERVRLENVLDAPDLEVTRLGPLPAAPGARAVVIASKSSGNAVLRASGLETPPTGKTYELWWITKQKGPVPAGTFTAESGNEVIAKVDPPPTGDRVVLTAVTLEPAGGGPKPTGAMYLKGAPERE